MAKLIDEANAYVKRNYPIEKVGIVANDAAFHAYVDGVNTERERCINAAQDAVCKVCASCYNISNCKKNGCGYFNRIRKAIEEGGNQ